MEEEIFITDPETGVPKLYKVYKEGAMFKICDEAGKKEGIIIESGNKYYVVFNKLDAKILELEKSEIEMSPLLKRQAEIPSLSELNRRKQWVQDKQWTHMSIPEYRDGRFMADGGCSSGGGSYTVPSISGIFIYSLIFTSLMVFVWWLLDFFIHIIPPVSLWGFGKIFIIIFIILFMIALFA